MIFENLPAGVNPSRLGVPSTDSIKTGCRRMNRATFKYGADLAVAAQVKPGAIFGRL
jgi:hypothetical protein